MRGELLFTWLPTFLRTERKLTVIGTGGYLAIVIIGSFVGYLVSAYLADRIGRRANFILFAVCSVVTVFFGDSPRKWSNF